MPTDKISGNAVDADTAIGTVVGGRYRIVSLIGRGGMASVYRAQDLELPREVALKLMPPGTADPEEVFRQRNEVSTLASLSHHALVTLIDAGTEQTQTGDRGFLVMELIDGPNLRELLAEPLPSDQVAHIAVDMAEALHCIHSKGIVHRDVKPANILLAPSIFPGRRFHAKLADFGIARLADAGRLTGTGIIIGSANYLSPEQARGAAVGPASDVYSLGLVLLEALTGRKAFPGTTAETITARLSSQPVIPSALGHGWSTLLAAMTALDPSLRPLPMDVAIAARQLADDGADPEDADLDTMAMDPTVSWPPVDPDPVAPPQPPAARLSRAAGRRAAIIAASAVIAVGAAAGAISWTTAAQHPVPTATYPSVSGSLGVHLQELQRNVIP
jgi:eukaryotic-like serine/threonine-protein kinase